MKQRRAIIGGALVVLAVLLVFSPVLRNGFVDWDDDILIYANPYIRGLDFLHLRWMLTSTLNSAWQPLGWFTLALIYKMFGLAAWAYHAQSLKLHLISTALVYAIGLELLAGDVAASALAALLFALHPLQVESVAWASCGADILCCMLSLGAIYAYLRSWRKTSYLIAAWAALARWEAVTIFPLLLILDGLVLKKKFPWRGKLPFLFVAMGTGAANAIAKTSVMNYQSSSPSVAAAALAQFSVLGRIVVPVALRPVYFITPESTPLGFSAGQAAVFLLGLTALSFMFRKKAPAALAAWLCCLAAIAPVVSMSRPGPLFVHDRYAYLPLAIVAMGIGALLKKRRALRPAASIVVVLLAAASIQRIAVWHDAESLWKSVAAVDPQESLAYYDLGTLYMSRGKPYQAIYYFREQARRNPEKGRPNLARAWNDLGAAYSELGNWSRAAASFSSALIYAPEEPQIKANLSAARARLRKH